jgi:hypothetical protein
MKRNIVNHETRLWAESHSLKISQLFGGNLPAEKEVKNEG